METPPADTMEDNVLKSAGEIWREAEEEEEEEEEEAMVDSSSPMIPAYSISCVIVAVERLGALEVRGGGAVCCCCCCCKGSCR